MKNKRKNKKNNDNKKKKVSTLDETWHGVSLYQGSVSGAEVKVKGTVNASYKVCSGHNFAASDWITVKLSMIISHIYGHITGNRTRTKEERQKKRWEDSIKEWTGLEPSDALRKAEDYEEWREVVAKTPVAPLRSMTMG